MASNPQILSDLRLIKEADHEIELLTTYKGIPFVCKARIEEIEGENARLKAQNPALVCLESVNQTRILGSDYFEPAMAFVRSFNIQTGDIELYDFTYVGTKLGERMVVRVEPKSPITVFIKEEGYTSQGFLVDLSLNGVGVHIQHANFTPTLRPGANAAVNIELPTGKVDLPGTVVSVIKNPQFYRLSIRFTQTGPEKLNIFRYLLNRRAEITQEIETEYQAALKSKG